MNKLISVVVVIALIAFYVLALPYALILWNKLSLPWLPFAGEIGVRMYARMSIPYALAVLTISLVAGAGIALRFPRAPFRFGLLLGILPAAGMIRLLLTHTLTGLMQLMVGKDVLLVILLPSLLAWLLNRLFRKWRQPAPASAVGTATSGA